MFCSVCLFLATAGIDFQRDQPDRTHTGNESNSSRADSPYRIGRVVQVSCRVAISAGVWLAKSSPRCREVGILDGSLKTRKPQAGYSTLSRFSANQISRSHRSFPQLWARHLFWLSSSLATARRCAIYSSHRTQVRHCRRVRQNMRSLLVAQRRLRRTSRPRLSSSFQWQCMSLCISLRRRVHTAVHRLKSTLPSAQ